MGKKLKFLLVPLTILSLIAGGLGFSTDRAVAFGTAGQVSTVADPVNGLNPATGFPMWYEDVTGGGGNKVQLCLGTGLDGVGPVDPKCILPGQVSPIDPVTAVGTNFPGESFYWFAEAPLTVNGNAARFRMALEGAFATDPAVVNGQQIVFARASLFTSQDNAFGPNGSFTVTYPFGSFSFTTDALGAMVASNPNPLIAPFQPNGGGAKEMRAEDGPGLAGDFTTVLTGTSTGITNFLTSTVAPAGYLGDGVTEAPVTGGTNGNIVTITGTPVTVVGGTNWIVSGKLFAPSIAVTPQTTVATTPAISGTVGDPTATVAVSIVGDLANANIPATVNPDGTWTATLASPLVKGAFDVQMTVNAGTPNESITTTTGALVVETTPRSMLFRFFSPLNNKHFFTISAAERDQIIASFTPQEWTFEGDAFNAFATAGAVNAQTVYRFHSPQTNAHFFTISAAERDQIIASFTPQEWTFEGEAFQAYSQQQGNTTPVYRFHSPQNNEHFFTISAAERDQIIATSTPQEWTFEGIAYFIPTF